MCHAEILVATLVPSSAQGIARPTTHILRAGMKLGVAGSTHAVVRCKSNQTSTHGTHAPSSAPNPRRPFLVGPDGEGGWRAGFLHPCSLGPPCFHLPTQPLLPKASCQQCILLSRSFCRKRGIAWSRLGSAPCNQIVASGFGAAGIKAFFYRYFTVFGRPAAPFIVARLQAAPPGAAYPPSFTRRFRPPRAPRTIKTINSSRWKGVEKESWHRLESMEGVVFFQKSLRSLRSRPIRRP
jgi:hypothetical protein